MVRGDLAAKKTASQNSARWGLALSQTRARRDNLFMAGTPTAETPPEGLDAHFLGVWRHALKVLKEQGTWAWELSPLLTEYVWALERADWARRNDEAAQWDRNVKRAAALADQLVLTPRGRKAAGLGEGEDDGDDPFGALDAHDELAKRREARQHSA